MSTPPPPTDTAIGDADGSPNYDYHLYKEMRDTFAEFSPDDLKAVLKQQDIPLEVRNAARHTLEVAVNGHKTLSPDEEAAVAEMAAKLAATPTAGEPHAASMFHTFGEAAEAAAAHIAATFGAAFDQAAMANLHNAIREAEHRHHRRAIAGRQIAAFLWAALIAYQIAHGPAAPIVASVYAAVSLVLAGIKLADLRTHKDPR